MLGLIQSMDVFAGIFILAVLAILLIFDPLRLRWSQAPRQNARRGQAYTVFSLHGPPKT